jgi:hypothetical protein
LGAYFSSEQSGLLLPFWLTDNFVLIPTLHLKYFQKQDLDFTLGLNTRHYLSVEELAVYFGFRVGSMLFIPYAQEEMDKSLRSDLFAGITLARNTFFRATLAWGWKFRLNSTNQTSDRNVLTIRAAMGSLSHLLL